MSEKTSIIDLGIGNIRSVYNALDRADADINFVSSPEEIMSADRLLLPGVGNSDALLKRLRSHGIDEALNEAIRVKAKPLLSICVGMQVFATTCFETKTQPGLGWYQGDVRHLHDLQEEKLSVPHVGFSDVVLDDTFPFQSAFRNTPIMYFNHSYAVEASSSEVAQCGTVDYGCRLGVCFSDQTWVAVQFHPEKSQQDGAKLIEAFLSWRP